jgi:hypothetical protein
MMHCYRQKRNTDDIGLRGQSSHGRNTHLWLAPRFEADSPSESPGKCE